VIPINLDKGQIEYSANGGNKTLSARSEQISVAGGGASTTPASTAVLDRMLYGLRFPRENTIILKPARALSSPQLSYDIHSAIISASGVA